jgi:hypothetical protein
VDQEFPLSISTFLDSFSDWAHSQSDIDAVALVGSYARGGAKEDSDVDLMILTFVVDQYLQDRSWLSLFGQVREFHDEDYGRVMSVRSFYKNGLEVEYSFSTPDWAKPPLDAGTLSVVSEGMKVLYDPKGIISGMQEWRRNCS